MKLCRRSKCNYPPKKLPIHRSFSQLQHRIDWTLFIFLRKISKHVQYLTLEEIKCEYTYSNPFRDKRRKLPKKTERKNGITDEWSIYITVVNICWTLRCRALIQLEIFNSNVILFIVYKYKKSFKYRKSEKWEANPLSLLLTINVYTQHTHIHT